MTTIIDIETGPATDDVLALVKPKFNAPANYKAQDKIDAYKLEAEAAWREKAALSALTGQILAIGLLEDTTFEILTESEPAMLANVWRQWADGSRFVGFNVKFDFRFMAVRSWALGVPVPADLMAGRYFNPRVICLQEIVTFFSKEVTGFSLDAVCKAFGLPGKLPGMTGADFARVFAEDKPKALEYLRSDLLATAALAQRLGIS